MNELNELTKSIDIDLKNFARQTDNPERFLACCETYAASTTTPEPLQFCRFLRESRFRREAKLICEMFLVRAPQQLAAFLG